MRKHELTDSIVLLEKDSFLIRNAVLMSTQIEFNVINMKKLSDRAFVVIGVIICIVLVVVIGAVFGGLF